MARSLARSSTRVETTKEGGRGPGRDRSMEAFGHPARVCVARITVVRAVYGGMGVRCMCRGCENLYRMRVRAHGDGVGWSMGRVLGGRGCVRPTDRSTDRGLATPPHLSLIDHSLFQSIDRSLDRSITQSIDRIEIDRSMNRHQTRGDVAIAMRARRGVAALVRAHASARDVRSPQHAASVTAAAAAARGVGDGTTMRPIIARGLSGDSARGTRFSARKIVKGLTRRALYDVVRDVGAYHEFVPFCKGSRVTPRETWRVARARAEDGETTSVDGREYFEADLEIGFTVFNEKYTSAVTCEAPRMVQARSVKSGLFENMTTTWRFTPLDGDEDEEDEDGRAKGDDAKAREVTDGGVIVDFEIDFQVRDPMHAAAVSMVFDDVANSQINAFEKRCKQLALNAARKT